MRRTGLKKAHRPTPGISRGWPRLAVRLDHCRVAAHAVFLRGTPPGLASITMAGLLTCGSRPSPPSRRIGASGIMGSAHRLQLRGQSWIWRLMATPHHVPFSPGRTLAAREPSPRVMVGNGRQVKRKLARRPPPRTFPQPTRPSRRRRLPSVMSVIPKHHRKFGHGAEAGWPCITVMRLRERFPLANPPSGLLCRASGGNGDQRL